MGASKSKRSRSRNIDANRYGSRPVAVRPARPVIIIVCDDARTAVAYFSGLKRMVKERVTLNVIPSPCSSATPGQVVDRAQRALAALQGERTHDESDRTAAWVVIDREHRPDLQRAADEAKSTAESNGISVALSHPCYEVWTLLHLLDTGAHYANCNAVFDRVKSEWARKFGQPLGPKGQGDYAKIVPDRHEAAQRARKHHEAGDPSWTQVYLLIEAIEAYCAE